MTSRANFFLVFVGIGNLDADTLVSMQKKQNTRRNLVTSLRQINEAGIMVIAGLIVGFDTERNPPRPAFSTISSLDPSRCSCSVCCMRCRIRSFRGD